MGARYVRKEMDCPTIKLKDLKVGVIAECDGEIIMKVCSDDYKFHFYNFTEGSNDCYLLGGPNENLDCKIIQGEITVKNFNCNCKKC